jgi:hypothetical protein
MKNIVEFPKGKIVREIPLNNELIELAKEKSLQRLADSMIDGLIDVVMQEFENYGVEAETKDLSLAFDALRASVYRHFEIDHPLHEFIDQNVRIVNQETGETIETEGSLDK